jgi:hypothetical protein
VNPLKFAMILPRRYSHEYTDLIFSMEYQASVSLFVVMTNDRFIQHCVISSSGGDSCLEAHYELMRVCLPVEFR